MIWAINNLKLLASLPTDCVWNYQSLEDREILGIAIYEVGHENSNIIFNVCIRFRYYRIFSFRRNFPNSTN